MTRDDFRNERLSDWFHLRDPVLWGRPGSESRRVSGMFALVSLVVLAFGLSFAYLDPFYYKFLDNATLLMLPSDFTTGAGLFLLIAVIIWAIHAVYVLALPRETTV